MRWADSNSHTLHGYIQDANGTDNNHQGGPHAGSSPVLYADGSVRGYPYLYVSPTPGNFTDDATWQGLWCYNRTFIVTPPE